MKNSIIKEKSFNFALEIIDLYKILQEQKEYILSKQLLRSATSIGANVNEDFVHKMTISNKEARESLYWLELFYKSSLIELDLSEYINQCQEITKILTSIVKTAKTS